MGSVADEYKREISEWLARINDRFAVKKELDIPELFEMKETLKTKEGEK